MVAPLPRVEVFLTGQLRVRRTWRGKLLLQVEFRADTVDGTAGLPRQVLAINYGWRDATADDAFRLMPPLAI